MGRFPSALTRSRRAVQFIADELWPLEAEIAASGAVDRAKVDAARAKARATGFANLNMPAQYGGLDLYAEILRDTAVALGPINRADAEALIRSLRGAPLLAGACGRAVLDVAGAAAFTARLSLLAATPNSPRWRSTRSWYCRSGW